MANKFETTAIFKESNHYDDQVDYLEEDHVDYAEDAFEDMDPEEVFGAGMASSVGTDDLKDVTLSDVLEPFAEGEGSLGELGGELGDLDRDVTEFLEEHGDVSLSDLLPGSDVSSTDIDEDEEEVETNYADDGDLEKFMEYVHEQYPANIPQHDGRSMVGCERAVSFLDKLNSQISSAIREDTDNVLDIQALEGVRVSIMKDVLILKKHLGKLKKLVKDEHDKQASIDRSGIPKWISASGREVEYEDLKKEAATPNNIVIAVSPFERAISGIMINAHVSGGHPIEEVYGFLADKYSIDNREELAIMQLCMDSGFHIFKDRGTYSPNDVDSKKDSNGKAGVDFLRNYFA
jgi:hypothetical protein